MFNILRVNCPSFVGVAQNCLFFVLNVVFTTLRVDYFCVAVIQWS